MDDTQDNFELGDEDDIPQAFVHNAREALHAYSNQIREHINADTVHIFVTKHIDGVEATHHAQYGLGNWYARKGQIQEWLAKDAAVANEKALEDFYLAADDEGYVDE